MLFRPSRHSFVPLIGPAIARFLMAPKRIDAEVLPRPIKNVHHITAAHNQRLTQIRERLLEIKQRFPTKQPLPFRCIRLLPQLRLYDVKRQHGPALERLDKRAVIHGPEISLEPHKLERRHPPASRHSVLVDPPRRACQSTAACILSPKLDCTRSRNAVTSRRCVIAAAIAKQTI